MKFEDDRTEEQKKTHVFAVVAKDKCMSGWGGATGGASRCAWACDPSVNTDRVENWVAEPFRNAIRNRCGPENLYAAMWNRALSHLRCRS
jgi:hypothetical protein